MDAPQADGQRESEHILEVCSKQMDNDPKTHMEMAHGQGKDCIQNEASYTLIS